MDYQGPNPKRLKTLAFDVVCSKGNNLLHQFVLDNSDPNDSGSDIYLNAVLLSMAGPSVDVNTLNDDGYSPLHLAVLKNNIVMVRKLLSCLVNIDVNAGSDLYENTALHLAAKSGHSSIMQELLNKGADVSMENFEECTALCFAAMSGDLDSIELLVNKGANVNIHYMVNQWLGWDHVTPLHSAVYSGKIENVKFLVCNGAPLDALDYDKETILHCAVRSGHVEIVKFLVSNGAVLDALNDENETVLHCAVGSGHVEIVKFLASSGADVNAKNKAGRTPLCFAAQSDNFDLVKLLLDKSKNVTESSSNLLVCAAQSDDLKIVEFAIDKGADLNAEDENGCTPLHFVIISSNFNCLKCYYGTEDPLNNAFYSVVIDYSYKRLDIMEMLLENGSDIDAKDKQGKTALHMAICTGNYVYARCLLGRGAYVNVADIDGWTPLHVAAHVDHVKIIEWLLGKGAEKNVKTKDGKTPLDLAKEGEHRLCINALK